MVTLRMLEGLHRPIYFTIFRPPSAPTTVSLNLGSKVKSAGDLHVFLPVDFPVKRFHDTWSSFGEGILNNLKQGALLSLAAPLNLHPIMPMSSKIHQQRCPTSKTKGLVVPAFQLAAAKQGWSSSIYTFSTHLTSAFDRDKLCIGSEAGVNQVLGTFIYIEAFEGLGHSGD